MSFVHFLASPRGRLVRALVGIALVLVGWFFLWYHGGIILALAGIALVLAAVNDVCFLARLYDEPIDGKSLRERQPDAHRHAHG